MSYIITNATTEDLPIIYHLFEEAIHFQKINNYIGWNNYDKEFIQADVQNNLLCKIVAKDEIACIFSICFTDKLIWREKESGDAIYLHRIVLNRKFKGEKLFAKVLDWTLQFALSKNLSYIRMDTWAENEKIITYYKGYGFSFIENYRTPDTDDLPIQYRNLHIALLEKKIIHS